MIVLCEIFRQKVILLPIAFIIDTGNIDRKIVRKYTIFNMQNDYERE